MEAGPQDVYLSYVCRSLSMRRSKINEIKITIDLRISWTLTEKFE